MTCDQQPAAHTHNIHPSAPMDKVQEVYNKWHSSVT